MGMLLPEKFLPIEDLQSEWTVFPPGTAHYAAVNETEDDLDTLDWIGRGIPADTKDRYRLQSPGRMLHVEQITARICIKAPAGVPFAFWVDVGLEGDPIWHLGYVWQPFTGDWEWRTPELCPLDVNRVVTVSEFDAWKVEIGGTAGLPGTAQYVAACYVQLIVCPLPLSAASNLFGQAFRLYPGQENLCFEKRDIPGGEWADGGEPFSGEGNHFPDLECLPDGRLCAAYINEAGELVNARSWNDGDTWEAA